jgi:uncharacterized protein YjiS (DUF1127 family)
MMGRVIVTFRTATGRPVRPSALAMLLGRAGALLLTWRERARQRRHLAELSDHLLKDMGLSRFEADHEASKRFWRG